MISNPSPRIDVGLEIDLPANPLTIGLFYETTDTQKLFVSTPGLMPGTVVWQQIAAGGGIPAQQGRIWYVDAAAAALGANGSPLNQFPTIALALAAAANGDEIMLAPGNYPESPTIAQLGLSLVSDGDAIIDGTLTLAGVSGTYLLDGITVVNGGLVLDTGGPASAAVVFIIRSSVNGTGAGTSGLELASTGWTISVRDSTIGASGVAAALHINATGINITIRNSNVTADMAGLNPSLLIDALSSVVRCIGTRFFGRVEATIEALPSFDACDISVDPAEVSYFVGVALVVFSLLRNNRVRGLPSGGGNVLDSGGGSIRVDGLVADYPVSLSGVDGRGLYTEKLYSLIDRLAPVADEVFVPAECGEVVLVTSNPGGNVDVFLPKASLVLIGKRVTIKNVARTGTLTIIPSLGDSVDGGGPKIINADAIALGVGFTACTIQLDKFLGSFNWIIVSP